MCIRKFYVKWLLRLGLKMFAMNDIYLSLPNIWCICKNELDPVIVTNDSQHVGFTISIMNISLGVEVVYALTCYLVRRQLWYKHLVFSFLSILRCFIGDFNVILGSYNHMGVQIPSRKPMIHSEEWSDINDLHHIPN